MSHLFQLGETCVSPFSIPGSNTAPCSLPLANFLKFRLSQSYRNVIELPLVGFYSSSCLAVLGTKKTERCISSDAVTILASENCQSM